jgi:hypothetical protein
MANLMALLINFTINSAANTVIQSPVRKYLGFDAIE